MNKEIGNVAGVSIMVNPETYEDIKKRKTIYENEILNELQQRIDKAIEYINKEEKIYEINKSSTQLGCIDFIVNTNDFKNRIINILRGEDNE